MGQNVKLIKVQKIDVDHPFNSGTHKEMDGYRNSYSTVMFTCKTETEVIEAIKKVSQPGQRLIIPDGSFDENIVSDNNELAIIDLSSMNAVHIDEVSKIATIEAGVTAAQLNRETMAYGLVTPLAPISKMKIAYMVTSGGFGFLRGLYGLTSDNVIGLNLVTATGELLYVNRFEHPDLFWAIRGSRKSFGVVTKLELKLYPLKTNILAIDVLYDVKDFQQIIQRAEEYRNNAVDEITFHFVLTNMRQTNKNNSASKSIRLIGVFAGELNKKVEEELIQPLLELATPIADNTEVIPYEEIESKYAQLFDSTYAMRKYFFMKELQGETLQMLKDYVEQALIPVTIHLLALHGQLKRMSRLDSAFKFRDANYLVIVELNHNQSPEKAQEWLAAVSEIVVADVITQKNSSEDFTQNKVLEMKIKYDPANQFD